MRPTDLEGVVIIEPTPFRDDRGFLVETYHRDRFWEAGIFEEFVQDNQSRSRRGVLRGIHLQDRTAPQAKLVRCVSGVILDVAVDLRLGSPTFGRWVAAELSADNLRQLMVPVGFGHAFLALSDADVQYKCSGFYTPSAERTVHWNDPEIAIRWPITEPIVSPKDAKGMSLEEYRATPAFVYMPPPSPSPASGGGKRSAAPASGGGKRSAAPASGGGKDSAAPASGGGTDVQQPHEERGILEDVPP